MSDDIHVSVRPSTGRFYRMELLVNIQPDMVLERHGDLGSDSRQLCLVEASPCEIGGRCLCALQSNADHSGVAPDPVNVRAIGVR